MAAAPRNSKMRPPSKTRGFPNYQWAVYRAAYSDESDDIDTLRWDFFVGVYSTDVRANAAMFKMGVESFYKKSDPPLRVASIELLADGPASFWLLQQHWGEEQKDYALRKLEKTGRRANLALMIADAAEELRGDVPVAVFIKSTEWAGLPATTYDAKLLSCKEPYMTAPTGVVYGPLFEDYHAAALRNPSISQKVDDLVNYLSDRYSDRNQTQKIYNPTTKKYQEIRGTRVKGARPPFLID